MKKIIILLVLVECLFLFGIIATAEKQNQLDSIEQIDVTEEHIIKTCSNKSLNETAFCLRDNIKPFYFYNVTIKSHSDIKTLKQIGGDCYNYAMLYVRLANETGFNSDYRQYDGEENVFPGHRWAYMWDNETYCKLDQLNIRCNERK